MKHNHKMRERKYKTNSFIYTLGKSCQSRVPNLWITNFNIAENAMLKTFDKTTNS